MNILFDGRSLADPSSGGVKRVATGLLQELRKQRASITVATSGTHRPPQIDEHLGIPNKFLSIAFALGLTSLDQLFSSNSDILFLPNIGWIGRPKKPYALIVHDLSFLIEPQWFSWKSRLWHRAIGAKRQIQNAKWIFAVSETTKRDLVDLLNIPVERITVIPMGINNESIPPTANKPPRPFLLALGAKDPRKNASLSRLVAKETGLDLKLVGDDTLGRISDKELDTLYAQATAFLYPSWYEGFGLPLHEAARFGTPCIASTAGALPETAPFGSVLASPAKPQHWVQAVSNILAYPSAYQTQTDLKDWSEAVKKILGILLKD